jgi:hypothetical protein
MTAVRRAYVGVIAVIYLAMMAGCTSWDRADSDLAAAASAKAATTEDRADSEDAGKVAPAAKEKPVLEPLAKKIIQEAGNYLKAAKALSFRAEITYDEVLSTGQKIQQSASNAVWMRRPDRVRADYNGDLRNTRAYYDGKTCTMLDLDSYEYWRAPMPGTTDAALDKLMYEHGRSVPLSDLIISDPATSLLAKVVSGHYVGLSTVKGVKCHHLAFRQKEIDWQIWIEDGKHLVPRKVVITYKTLPKSPQYTALLSGWEFHERLPDRLFIFQPAEDAKRIDPPKPAEKQ